MAETIAKLVIKKTSSPGAIPLSVFLDYGELALNYTDGKLFFKNNLGNIISIGEVDDTDFAKKSEGNDFIGVNSFGGVSNFNGIANVNAGLALNVLTLTDGAISWNTDLGNLATVTLAENSTLENLTNVSPGSYVLRVVQDATGGRTLSFGSNYKTPNGDAFEIGTAPGAITIITILNAGGSDLYLVGQADFALTTLLYVEPPAVLGVVGTAGGGDWLNDTTYIRVPDVNGENAWIFVRTPLEMALISAGLDGIYKIEVFGRLDPLDAWTITEQAFIANAVGNPWEVASWADTGSFSIDGAVIVSTVATPAFFSALVTVSPGDPGALGQTVEFFADSNTFTWYGTDPIPPGSLYRCVNPFQGLNTQPHLYMAPRDNDVNGDWVIGLDDGNSNNELFEFMYLPAGPGTPAGTYNSSGLPGSEYSMVVTDIP